MSDGNEITISPDTESIWLVTPVTREQGATALRLDDPRTAVDQLRRMGHRNRSVAKALLETALHAIETVNFQAEMGLALPQRAEETR